MGLSIEVFHLAWILETEDDPNFISQIEASYEALNQALVRNNLPSFHEPEVRANDRLRHWLQDFSYRDLHYLRRFYAHARHNPLVIPAPPGEERPSLDPILDAVSSPEHHLLEHSDNGGFYVPIEFDSVIYDPEVEGEAIGSSHKLMAELLWIAPFLDIHIEDGTLTDAEAERVNDMVRSQQDPYEIEKAVWIALFESARISIQYNTAIVFC